MHADPCSHSLPRVSLFFPLVMRAGTCGVYREDKELEYGGFLAKEPQYFNRWPLLTPENYLHAFHSGVVGAMMSGAAGHRVLLDASPQYLMSAQAPPRIKAVVPHAKFVLVIRVRPGSHAERRRQRAATM
jgi:hypothetical protein